MSQWESDDSAANSVLWGPSLVKLPANGANRDALFGNTTADAFVENATVATYGVGDNEMNYDTWKIIGAVPGSNSGVSVLITSNGTTQYIANGTGSTNAVINVESVKVSTAAINAAGEGYSNGDKVTLVGGDGTGATFEVTANATGNATAISILTPGYFANSADVPGAVSNTSNTTGDGTGLKLDITLGAETLSLQTEGSYTAEPDTTDFALTAEGDQTGTGLVVNLTTTKFNAKQAVAHAGHVLVTQGTGGRAGRIQTETLVTQSALSADAEDTLFANT